MVLEYWLINEDDDGELSCMSKLCVRVRVVVSCDSLQNFELLHLCEMLTSNSCGCL